MGEILRPEEFNDGDSIPLMIRLLLFFNLFVMYFFFRDPLDFYVGYLFILTLFPIYFLRYGIPKNIGVVFSVLLVTGVGHVLLKNNDIGSLLKVYACLFGFFLFFYYIVFDLKLSIHGLFKTFLAGVLISASVAIFQSISFFAGFRAGYDLTWIHST